MFVAAGGEARLGVNPLIENTTITETGFNHFHQRTEDPAGNGNVTTRFESVFADPLPFLAGNSLIRRFSVVADNSSFAEAGVGGDNDDYSYAYLKSGVGGVEAYVQLSDNTIRLETVTGGISDGFIIFSNGILNASLKSGSVINTNGNFFMSQSQLFEGFGSPLNCTRQTVFVDFTALVNGFVNMFEIQVAANENVIFDFQGVYREAGVAVGAANVSWQGGGCRNAAAAATVTSSSATIRETLPGPAAAFQIVAVGNSIFLQVNRNVGGASRRFGGILTIIKTIIPI
jgi:hypothetical protein